jgi:hypothetical protein
MGCPLGFYSNITWSRLFSPRQRELRHMDTALLGVVTLIAGLLILPVMDSIAKLLAGHVPTIEVVWARFIFYSVALVPLACVNHGRAI